MKRATQEGRLIIRGEDYARVTKETAREHNDDDSATRKRSTAGGSEAIQSDKISNRSKKTARRAKREARRRHTAGIKARDNLT